jgi:hypothetical protein
MPKKTSKKTAKKVQDATLEPVDIGSAEAKKVPLKQYTVIYTIGNEPQFFVANGTDFKLSTIDVQSLHTGEMFAYPVIFVVDDKEDTMDIIPMNQVGNLRYNWGYKEESEKFAKELKELQAKMKTIEHKKPKEPPVSDHVIMSDPDALYG